MPLDVAKSTQTTTPAFVFISTVSWAVVTEPSSVSKMSAFSIHTSGAVSSSTIAQDAIVLVGTQSTALLNTT